MNATNQETAAMQEAREILQRDHLSDLIADLKESRRFGFDWLMLGRPVFLICALGLAATNNFHPIIRILGLFVFVFTVRRVLFHREIETLERITNILCEMDRERIEGKHFNQDKPTSS